MNALLNDLGYELAAYFVWLSMEMAVLAAVVFVVIHVFQIRSAKLRCWFWALVFVKPVVGFWVVSPVTIYTALQVLGAEIDGVVLGAWFGGQGQGGHVGGGGYVMVSSRLNAYGILGLVWGMLVVVLSIRLMTGRSMVLFLSQQSVPQKRGVLFDALTLGLARLRIRRRVVVRVSAVVQTPMQCGFWRPVILFPQNMVEVLTPDQIRLVMLHELAHVKRWDNALLLFERMVEVVLFFHPIIWLCGRALRREVENACDDVVLGLDENPVVYANSLVRVAEWREQLESTYLVQAFIDSYSDFARRVKRLLNGPHFEVTTVEYVVGMVVFVLVSCSGLPSAVQANEHVDALYESILEKEGSVYNKREKKNFHRQVKDVIAHYRECLVDDGEDAASHYRLARMYMVLNTVNDRQRAKRALKNAIRLDKNNVTYQLALGKLLWSQMFWYNGNAHYEQVVDAFPDDLKAKAQAHYWMGFYALHEFLAYQDRLIMGNEEFAETDRLRAIASFKESITADPDFRDPYYHLGLVYLESHQPDSLVHYARRLIQRYPDDAHALLFCGLGYQSLGDELQAHAFYTTALGLMSDDEREQIESLEYVVTEDDHTFVDSLGVVDRDRFWRQKDPLLLTSFNESQMDHYRRVAYANLRFSRMLRGIPGWQTDQGKTHIRFGPYLSRSVYERRETWHYGKFRIHFRSGADLDAWYFDGEEFSEALASLSNGYWPDHGRAHFQKQPPTFHDPYRAQKYSMPYQVSAFRQDDGLRLEVAYAIPVAKVDVSVSDRIDKGLFLFDAQWDSVYQHVDKVSVFDLETVQTPEGLFWVAQYERALPLQTHRIVAEVGDYKLGAVGVFRAEKEWGDVGAGLAMSDPLLASHIEMLKPFPESRDDLKVVQNPVRTFRQTDFLHLYFEVYGLTQDDFGRTYYDVSYRVGWPKEEEVDASLFLALEKPDAQLLITESGLAPDGFRDYQVRYVLPEQPHLMQKKDSDDTETEVTVNYEGDRANDFIFLNIDLSQVPVGVHQLRVVVREGDVRVSREVFFRVIE